MQSMGRVLYPMENPGDTGTKIQERDQQRRNTSLLEDDSVVRVDLCCSQPCAHPKSRSGERLNDGIESRTNAGRPNSFYVLGI
jgi:hypothetical protein